MAEPPIIIKKVVKKGGHGHHGGAWKLAYADFVTAMMAFFLLMWLLGSVDEKTKKGISEYFQDPYRATKVDKGLVPSLDEKNPTELDKQADKEAQTQLENLRIKIERIIKMNDKLDKMRDQVKLTITPEGLRIQIVDDKKTPMFKSGSAEAAPHIREILKELAPVINQLPNKITVNGHTDSKPFPDESKKFTNWELSSERANAARFELIQAGYDEKKVLRVSGLSDSVPYNANDSLDPMNRRISIIVMNKKSELQLLEEVGNKATVLKDNKPAEGGAAPPAEGGHGETPKAGEGEPAAPATPAAESSHGEAPAAAEGEHKPVAPAEPAPAAGAEKSAAPEPATASGQGEPKAAEGEQVPPAPAEPAAAPAAEAAKPGPEPAPPAEHH
jgi:chemotaxis protein MotB